MNDYCNINTGCENFPEYLRSKLWSGLPNQSKRSFVSSHVVYNIEDAPGGTRSTRNCDARMIATDKFAMCGDRNDYCPFPPRMYIGTSYHTSCFVVRTVF
jgi:hypothetical protein